MHVGGGAHVSLEQGIRRVDILYFVKSDEKLKATTNGVSLKYNEWEILHENVERIMQCQQELKEATPRYLNADHLNHLGIIQCAECNPYRDFVEYLWLDVIVFDW